MERLVSKGYNQTSRDLPKKKSTLYIPAVARLVYITC